MTKPILRAESLTRRLGELEIVIDVSLELAAGEWMSLVGPSGCGKTTLLMLLGLLDRQNAGRVYLADDDTTSWSRAARAKARLRKVGFIFQANNLLDHLTTRDNIALPRWKATGSRSQALDDADRLIARFGLTARAGAPASTLSAGEAQRAAIARALVNEPVLVLADEPTGNLDSANTELVLTALSEVTVRGAALLVVTHDSHVADRGRRVAMRDGRLDV
jgi:putative ABC transport system ATP-binding protein